MVKSVCGGGCLRILPKNTIASIFFEFPFPKYLFSRKSLSTEVAISVMTLKLAGSTPQSSFYKLVLVFKSHYFLSLCSWSNFRHI